MILPPHQRGNLTNAQWQHLQPLLPPEKPSVGRPNNDHRKTINGILWILRTGAPWRDLRLALWSDRNSIGTVLSLAAQWDLAPDSGVIAANLRMLKAN